MKNDKVTITNIANALNTSIVSVSRALSAQPGVSEQLKKQIIEKATEMGYKKGQKQDCKKILVLHNEPHLADNSHFSHISQGIERALQSFSINYSTEYIEKEAQSNLILPYRFQDNSQFDGVILVGRFHIPYAHFIHERIQNLIFFTGYSPAYDYDSVWYGFMNAGYKQCEYLIQKGHSRIGFLGEKSFYRNKEKILGISSALDDCNIKPIEENFIDLKEDYKATLETLLLQKCMPTSFICDSDYSAMHLMKFLHEHNLRIPDDVSVLGSGNTEISLLSSPSLTTMDLNIDYACSVVVSTLLKRIKFPDKPSENIAILSNLIERDSVLDIKNSKKD